MSDQAHRPESVLAGVAAPRFAHLLLDFGGVCIPHPFERPQLLVRAFGPKIEQMRWGGPIDPDNDPLWRAQQAGEITEREYWAEQAARVGELVDGSRWTLQEFMHRFHGNLGDGSALIRPQADRVVDAALAAGVTVAVLSNDLRYFAGDHFVDHNPFLAKCDPIVDASVTGVLKPDPGAYRLALEAIGARTPGGVLFVDDQPANARGGEAAGLAVVAFDVTRPDDSWRQVAARLFSEEYAVRLLTG